MTVIKATALSFWFWFFVFFFGHEASGILVPWPGIELTSTPYPAHIGRAESSPLDHQGGPSCTFLKVKRLVALLSPTLCNPMDWWTTAHQASLSMGFSRQDYWKGLPFPSPGDLPNPGIEPGSPALQLNSLLSEPPGKPTFLNYKCCIHFTTINKRRKGIWLIKKETKDEEKREGRKENRNWVVWHPLLL